MERIDIDLTAMQGAIVQQGIQAKEGIGGVSLTSRKAHLALNVLPTQFQSNISRCKLGSVNKTHETGDEFIYFGRSKVPLTFESGASRLRLHSWPNCVRQKYFWQRP